MAKEDRKVDGVDANTYSNLKCIYNKFRDQLTTAENSKKIFD